MYPGSSSTWYGESSQRPPENPFQPQGQVPVKSSRGIPTARKVLLWIQVVGSLVVMGLVSALQYNITPTLDTFIFNTRQVHPSFVFPLLVSVFSVVCSVGLLGVYYSMKHTVQKKAVVADVIVQCILLVGWFCAAYATGVALVGFRYSDWPPNCSEILGVESWFCPVDILVTVLCLVMALFSIGGLLCKMRGHRFIWLLFVPGAF